MDLNLVGDYNTDYGLAYENSFFVIQFSMRTREVKIEGFGVYLAHNCRACDKSTRGRYLRLRKVFVSSVFVEPVSCSLENEVVNIFGDFLEFVHCNLQCQHFVSVEHPVAQSLYLVQVASSLAT